MTAAPRWTMTGDAVRVHGFFADIGLPLALSSDMKGIGLERDGRLIAGALYEGFNGRNVWVHLAGEPGSRWMTREFLRYGFHYPFNELKVERLSGYVNESNQAAIRLDLHLGYEIETRLKGAAPDGGDVLIFVMWRDKCRWIKQ